MFKNSLTPKQQIFITEYLIYKNATKAAKLAGYSAKTARSAGSRLLTNVDIFLAIEKGLREQVEKAEISANRLLLELKRIAFADTYEGRGGVGKLRALELLGNSLGLFKDKVEPKARHASSLDMLGLLGKDSRRS